MNTLKLTQIVPDPNQPRKYFAVEKMASLKDSIKRVGMKQPIVVYQKGDKYFITDGERRYRVAKELGFKEIAVVIEPAKNDFDRLIEQFHIQEQHESWSPTEKAMAIMDISEMSKKSMKEVCELLSVNERMIRYYIAFGKLHNKAKFIEYQCSLENAEKINEVKTFVRKIKEQVLTEPFTKAEENTLEKVLIDRIHEKQITERGDYSRIKDLFRTEPKLIDRFMKDNKFDVNTAFVSTKAAGARFIRNMITSSNYVISNGMGFLKDPNVKLADMDIQTLKRCKKICDEVVNLVE
jgi:ParB/RepB/Spo0J family partition protein